MEKWRVALVSAAVCMSAAAQTAVRMESPGANLPAQKIGIDDLVAVSVYGAPELTLTVRVGAEGHIALPMLKRTVKAADLLPGELETSIAEALRTEQIFVHPVVTVTVAEYRSRPIRVAGAVRRPVTFQASGVVTLLDALNRAEGLAPEAGPDILLTALGKTRRISVSALMSGDAGEVSPVLRGGEEIRVPEAGRIYVVGSVKHPGVFTLKETSETSVLKALALAEGLVPFASREAYIYRRRPGAASPDEIPIALNRIIQRKSPDVALAAGDTLYVPDSKGRRLTTTAIERIAGFAAATASGLLIWRR